MKYLVIVFILLSVISCSPRSNRSEALTVQQYQDALLMSKNVYTLDTNVDNANSAHLPFVTTLEGQQIELNLTISAVNNSSLGALPLSNGNMSSILIGAPEVYLNDVNITSCLIDKCVEHKCSVGPAPLDLANGFNSSRIYLSLNDIASKCGSSFAPTSNSQHEIVFKNNLVGIAGYRVRAQVIAYNFVQTFSQLQQAVDALNVEEK